MWLDDLNHALQIFTLVVCLVSGGIIILYCAITEFNNQNGFRYWVLGCLTLIFISCLLTTGYIGHRHKRTCELHKKIYEDEFEVRKIRAKEDNNRD